MPNEKMERYMEKKEGFTDHLGRWSASPEGVYG